MPYGTLAADTIQSSTAGTPVQFNDGNGTQVGTLCRAWVNFNGISGSVAIRASFNVSSVTRTGTGQYTITFTNALSDANYAAGALCGYDNNSNPYRYTTAFAWSASSLKVYTFYTSGGDTTYDSGYITVSIFR